jgi:hypothetical protein
MALPQTITRVHATVRERVSSTPSSGDKIGARAMLIGYARVSTQDQTLDLQTDALTAAGCEKIFQDTTSGAKSERLGLQEAMNHLRPADTFVVWRLDRLGRTLKHLIATITDLNDKGIGFRSLHVSIGTNFPGKTALHQVYFSRSSSRLSNFLIKWPIWNVSTQRRPGMETWYMPWKVSNFCPQTCVSVVWRKTPDPPCDFTLGRIVHWRTKAFENSTS